MELVGGAVLEAFVGELLNEVLDAKQRVSTFQLALARLESTLKAMIPRLDQISCLNCQLNLQRPELEELVALMINGKALVLKCSKVSTINLLKKMQYSKELLDLDNSLLRKFMAVLPLDHIKDTNKIQLVVVKELQMKLVGDYKDGGICDQSESAASTHEVESTSGALETMKLLQDSNHELKQKALLAHANEAKFQGIKLFDVGLYAEALMEYEFALHVSSEIPSAKDLHSTCYANRAICFLKLGEYEDAVIECNRALELNPDYLQALIKRGEAHKKLQQFDEAIADMETLILKLVPTDVQSKRTKDFLVAAVKRLEMKLANNKADGEICNKDADDATTSTAVI